MDSLEKRIGLVENGHKDLNDKMDQVLAAIKGIAGPATSSVAKKVDKPKVPSLEELKEKTLEVTYNANANRPKLEAKPTKGTFYFKHPTVRDPETKDVIPAFEAITKASLVIWFVENTWLGTKGKSHFIEEVI